MRSVFVAAFALIALVSYVHCGCDEDARSPDDSDFSVFFKNLGCDFKKISDSAKPWVDRIEDSARQLSDTVVDKFSDLKSKISGSSDDVATETPAAITTPAVVTAAAVPSVLTIIVTPSAADLPATTPGATPAVNL